MPVQPGAQRRHLSPMLLFLPMLASIATPAHADMDVSVAVLQTQNLQNDINSFNAITVLIIGPYTLNYKHTVIKTTSVGGHDYQSHKTYNCSTTISFDSTQKDLVNAVQSVPSGISALQDATRDLGTWSNLVPGTSAQFNALVAQETELKASSQTGTMSDEQKNAFDASLSQTQNSISGSTTYLQTSSQSMVSFIQQSYNYQNTVTQAISTASASAVKTLDDANNNIKKQGCPSGLGGDYNRIKADINGWIDGLNTAESKSAAESTAAQQSAAELAAFALSSQTNLASIQKELSAASAQDYGTFIQQLDLSVAQQQWNAIAAADQQNRRKF